MEFIGEVDLEEGNGGVRVLRDNLVTKEEHFFNSFRKNLQSVRDLAEQMADGSLLQTYLMAILKVAAPAIAGKFLGSAIPTIQISGHSVAPGPGTGDALAFAGGALGAWFAYRGIRQEEDAKRKAGQIVRFFTACPDVISFLAESLYREFRISIEMLDSHNEGIGVLVKYFIDCLLEVIDQLPESLLLGVIPKAELLDRLRTYMFDSRSRNNISTCALRTHNREQHSLEWKLDELMLHSPILLLSISADRIADCTIHLNRGDSKRRRQGFFYRSLPAEASHKYPVRVIDNREALFAVQSYRHDETVLSPRKCKIPRIVRNHSFMSYDTQIVHLYYLLRQRRRNPDDSQIFLNMVEKYVEFVDILLREETKLGNDPINLLVNNENLRNIFWNEIRPSLNRFASRDGALVLEGRFDVLSRYLGLSEQQVERMVMDIREVRRVNDAALEEVEEKYKGMTQLDILKESMNILVRRP